MFAIDFIQEVLQVLPYGKTHFLVEKFIINSQIVDESSCFIGLPGARCHGSSFFQAALEKGARGLLIDNRYKDEVLAILDLYDCWVFFVDDTHNALLELARAWRKKLLSIPIIAITGSAGKTTTKEMIKKIYQDKGCHILATANSENGTIGLPLTILQLRPDHDIAIIEVGIQKIGEMEVLTSILQSIHTCIITTILLAHQEYFQTIDNVIQEKMKLQLIATDLLIIPENMKSFVKQPICCVLVGITEQSSYQYQSLATVVTVFDKKRKKSYEIKSFCHTGFHHCLIHAFACSIENGFEAEEVIHSLENFKRVPGRFSIHNLSNGSIIINDAYNAADLSVMEKSIEAFIFFPTHKKKVLVIGDMLEQGESEKENHALIYQKIDALAAHYNAVFFVGPRFGVHQALDQNKKINFAVSIDDIKNTLAQLLNNQHCVFFKSSRSMALFHYVTDYLKNHEY